MVVLMAIAVGAFLWHMRQFSKRDAEADRLREERWAREDEESKARWCAMWRSLGEKSHRANCERCMGGKRGQA
jgi:hypothetical protein